MNNTTNKQKFRGILPELNLEVIAESETEAAELLLKEAIKSIKMENFIIWSEGGCE